MNIENENTFRAALAHSINLFVGAGFSVLARNAEGKPLPLGAELATELATVFDLGPAASLALPKICTILEYSKKQQLREYLTVRYSVSSFDRRYNVLDKFQITNIFTTNIDNLIYEIYSRSTSNYIHDVDIRGPAYKERHAINLITLHGSVLDPNRPFTFSVSDLASAFAADQDKWFFLTQRLQEHPTLFWGYSVEDAGTLEALNPQTSKGRPHKDKWIVIHPSSIEGGTVDYFHALGFQIIESDTESFLDYLDEVSSSLRPGGTSRKVYDTRQLFEHDSIPAVGSVPVRPILNFYLGTPPQWSDIFSGSIHRTSHFNTVLDSINSKRRTIMIGIPASGKTTLMMQAAAEVMFDGHKVITNSLNVGKAHFIINVLGGENALIFVDNFSDSLEAFEYLSAQPNIQLVGAERDYNFEIVAHRVGRDSNIIDVSELTDADTQACLQHIPDGLKRLSSASGPATSRMKDRKAPQSLFEIIERNIKDATLKTRFRSVVMQLDSEAPDLRDLLIMISYVGECRCPTSMDMLFAYLRDITRDYSEIMEMRVQLGAIISEHGGTWGGEDDQDYFVPRSSLVSEAVIANATQPMLKEMLLRFHANVTPYRISNYDVFRRHAYDNKLIGKAFPVAEEGRDFYERLYERDASPYMLQHAALYLSSKGQSSEAFNMIDRAISESGGLIWSIRNSHAIILFKANIDHAGEPGARETLRQSLTILTDCYKWDKRKPYHTTTFAEEAIQYFQAYGDTEATEYLETARKWLVDEVNKSPWNRRVRQLLPQVEALLQRY